jgi:RNA-directed DNA polymerase
VLRNYCYQAVRRTVEYGGTFQDIEQGISRGSPLSPLLGALYLKALDDKMSKQGIFYVRYMDDILIMTKTRWQNRRAVKLMNQTFDQLNVQQHPDKTFIGRIERGFDFLGYHFSTEPLQLAAITVKKHLERLHRFYEQQDNKKATPEEVALVLGVYVKRWRSWCHAGLAGFELDPFSGGKLPNLLSQTRTL